MIKPFLMIFLFFGFGQSALTWNKFWGGSPLFLNLTVLLATLMLILSIIYFIWHHKETKKRQLRALRGNSSIANQNQDFDPSDDHDPNRPMAMLLIPKEGAANTFQIAGNTELFKQLPHVTYEVWSTVSAHEKIDIFKPANE